MNNGRRRSLRGYWDTGKFYFINKWFGNIVVITCVRDYMNVWSI